MGYNERIDPLLAAVDHGFASAAGAVDDCPGADRLADAVDTLVATLTGHLTHEEKDGLPLIGVALTAAEWRGVGFKIARRNGLSAGGEMFSWMLSSATPDEARAVTRQLPPPVRVLYKAAWKPRKTVYTSGALYRYAQNVGPARAGAVTHPGAKAEGHMYADI